MTPGIFFLYYTLKICFYFGEYQTLYVLGQCWLMIKANRYISAALIYVSVSCILPLSLL